MKPTPLLATQVPWDTQASGAPNHLSGLWSMISQGCVCSARLLNLCTSSSSPSAQHLPQAWSRVTILQMREPEPTEAEN